MVRPIIEEAKQKLEIHLPTAPLQVNGDVSRLTQVVANLLTNAARFTPGGGRISVTAWQEGGMAVLCVADNGRGISPDDLRTIFGMFIQGKEPLHRVGGGLGIGLALSRSICDLHGGTIEAKSEGEGAGSQFIVRLPSSREQIREVQQGSAHATRSPEKIAAKRVLIVDDNLDAARTLDLLLTSLGHETSIAADGLLALQAADAFRPDVVLLDLGLPGISGYEVARRLRQTGKPMRIVAITGWGQESDRKRSQDAGFDLHLVKPVDEVELRDVVEANGRGLNTLH
jgi:CheY-like chemotaxis protein